MRVATDRGENHYQAQLTAEQVHQARIYVMKGPVGTLPLCARRWGIATQTLRNAVIYKNWKWLPPPTPEEVENTPLPHWIDSIGAPHRTHCGMCVHWEHNCTMGIPEAGGFFATSCAAYATASFMH
jgi:hypothetical protein